MTHEERLKKIVDAAAHIASFYEDEFKIDIINAFYHGVEFAFEIVEKELEC